MVDLGVDAVPGTHLAGYRLEHVVGRGGMGVVYCARHLHLDRKVAVKVLSPGVADREDFRKRFIRESRTAASLNHPNIVTVYDAGEEKGRLYIAMRFIEGSDLHTLLRAETVLSPERTLSIIEQIASALDAAHDHGLIHRDVKPGNILIDGDHAYLTDFGLTKRLEMSEQSANTTSAATLEGQFLGTVDYCAPEQYTGGELDGRTDQYALGCILYLALSGEVPFPRRQPIETLYAKMHDPPPRLSSKRPDLPPGLDRVITTALARQKEHRYARCHDFVQSARAELRDVLPAPTVDLPRHSPTARAGAAITGPTTPLPAIRKGGLSRRDFLLAAAGITALGVTLALVLILGGGDNGKPAPPQRSTAAAPPLPAGPPVSTVNLGGLPTGLTVGATNVWVADSSGDRVERIARATGAITGKPIPVGQGPIALTAASGYLWVVNKGSNSVQRIDPAAKTVFGQPIAVGNSPVAIRRASGSLWVVSENDGAVTRVNQESGLVTARITIGGRPSDVTATKGVVWVADRANGTVKRIDTATNQVIGAPIRVGPSPLAMTVANGWIWVTRGDGVVQRLSIARAGLYRGPIHVGHAPRGIAYGAGYVWVANSGDDDVTKLNVGTGEVIGRPIRVGHRPTGVAVAARAVWVTDSGSGTVSRIKIS